MLVGVREFRDSDGLNSSLLQFLIIARNLNRQVVELFDEENNSQLDDCVENLLQFLTVH